MTFQDWVKFIDLAGQFHRLPVRQVQRADVRYLQMENTFVAVATYAAALQTRPHEIGLDAAHNVRLVLDD
jgi:hypothetical protein